LHNYLVLNYSVEVHREESRMGAIEARATFSNLGAVAGAAPLEQLTKPQLQELQIALACSAIQSGPSTD
jgi:hypothetical protein